MKSIFLSDSYEEAIVEFVNSTRNFTTRHTRSSKTSRRRNDFGRVAASRNLSVPSSLRLSQDKLLRRAPKTDLVEGQLCPSAAAAAAAAIASVPDTSQETDSQMEISITSDVTHQPLSTSPSQRPPAVATTTPTDPVLDKFQQMRSMISRFWCMSGPYSKSKTVIL